MTRVLSDTLPNEIIEAWFTRSSGEPERPERGDFCPDCQDRPPCPHGVQKDWWESHELYGMCPHHSCTKLVALKVITVQSNIVQTTLI